MVTTCRYITPPLCFATFALGTIVLFISASLAQERSKGSIPTAALLTRTSTRHETIRLGYGGTVTIIGAPDGSITIEGWSRSEVEIAAVTELHAGTEEDLNLLAAVNGFVLDDESNHLRVLSTGTHDNVHMRRVAKTFPRKLLGLPWKIDYRIRVPVSTDLEINAGRGPISINGVEGAITLTATESETEITMAGGSLTATLALGKVNLRIPVRSWRGSGAAIQIASGDLTIELPVGFNGDIDADILRTGKIDESYGGLESRERPGVTDRVVRARAGAGGAFFKFTVGDGTVRFKKARMVNLQP